MPLVKGDWLMDSVPSERMVFNKLINDSRDRYYVALESLYQQGVDAGLSLEYLARCQVCQGEWRKGDDGNWHMDFWLEPPPIGSFD